MNPPTATVFGDQRVGANRLDVVLERGDAGRSTTLTICQSTSWPAEAATCSRSSRSELAAMAHRVCGITRIRLDVEQVDAEHERLEGLLGHAAARVAEDLRVARLEADHGQRGEPGVHARDDRDTGVRDAVEAGHVEVVGILAVGGQEVVELVLAHGPER